MPIQKINSSRNLATRSTYVGEKGRLFYDEANGVLYISDGTTAGGSSVFNKLVNGNYSATLDASGNLTVPGNLTVQGTTTTVNNETINNNDTITGTLTVSGNSTFNGTVNTLTNATLTGSGTNLFTYSQVFNQGNGWSYGTCTVTVGATDPLSGTTASTVTGATDVSYGGSAHIEYTLDKTRTTSNTNYCFSFYVQKANPTTGATTVSLAIRDNSSGNFPSQAFTVTSSWQRIYLPITSTSGTNNYGLTFFIGSTNGPINLWGAQVNLGSTPTIYTATTNTAALGYPTLSFASNGSIQQDTSGNILVVPSGTGTVQIGNTAGNYVQISNAAAGTSPVISVVGVDSYPSLYLLSKSAPLILGTRAGTSGSFQVLDIGQAPVNILRVSGSLAGVAPSISVSGTDTNIDVAVTPKGTGAFVTTSELLKGTGQNLIRQSNTWTTTWSPGNLTAATTAATTDPLGTTTAYQLTESTDGVATNHAIGQGLNTPLFVGTTYTWSVYAKAATQSWLYLSNFDNTRRGAWFNLSTGVLGTVESGVTAVITGQGNGWYRCSVTTTLPSVTTIYPYVTLSNANNADTYIGTGAVAIYVWRAQLEFGSTPGTYIPTTTALVWNIPSLSFISSVSSGIGLQSDGSLYVSPGGTGALQAQKTDSAITGGNIRGQYAVDWQLSRGTATQVASGNYTVIAGGYNNTNTGAYSVITGGYNNSAAGGGSVISGGNSNTVGSNRGIVVGGQNNNASGLFGIVVGGASNLATSSTAVTTAVMTIAVTASTTLYLTATNANVKIGQYIVGPTQDTYATSTVTTGTTALNTAFTSTGSVIAVTTGILTIGTLTAGTIVAGQVLSGTGVPAGTYVVSNIAGGSASGSTWNTNIITAVASTAINGTAYTITISQNTTTAAGTTITFYTPHGVVVGGGNNQATGSFSFIGAGGDAGTPANRNVASGDWSAIVGGKQHLASGLNSFIGGGNANQATATYATVAGGINCYATGFGSSVLGGYANTASGGYSAVVGGTNGTSRNINGSIVFPANIYPLAPQGSTQASFLVLAKQTIDATATVLLSDTSTAAANNQVFLPVNSAYYFVGSVIAGVTGGGNTKAWTFEGAIKKGAANSAALVGTPVVNVTTQDSGASAWSIAITANTTTDTLTVTVTGQAATTIRWVCKIETTEMTF